MAVDLGSAVGRILLDVSDVGRSLAQAEKDVKRFGDRVAAVGANLQAAGRRLTLGVTLPIVGLGAAALKTAVDFDKAMFAVNSVLKLSGREFQALKQDVLDFSTTTSQSSAEVAYALQGITASGYGAQDAMAILRVAVDAAGNAMSDTSTTTRALTATLKAYGMRAEEVRHVSDVLFTAVNNSAMSFDELTATIGDALGTAAAANVPLETLAAAMMTMSSAGYSAAESSTALRALILQILKPSEDFAAVLAKWGYASGEAALQTLGLEGVMRKLYEETEGSAAQIATLIPNIRGAKAAFALATQDGAALARALDLISQASEGLGEHEKMRAVRHESVAYAMAKLRSEMEVFAIQLADVLLPSIQSAIKQLTTWFTVLATLPPEMTRLIVVMAGVAAAAGPLLVLLGAMLSPIGAVALAVGALAAAWTQNWGDIQGKAQAVWGVIQPVLDKLRIALEAVIGAVGGLQAGALTFEQFQARVESAARVAAEALGIDFALAVEAVGKAFEAWRELPGVVDAVREALGELAAFGRDVAAALGEDGLGGALSVVGEEAAEVGPKIAEAIGDATGQIIVKLTEWGQAFVNWIGPYIPPLLAKLNELATRLLAWLVSQAPLLPAKLQEWAVAFVDWVGPAVSPLLAELGRLAREVVGWIADQAGGLAGELAEWGLAFMGWVAPMIPDLLGALAQLAGDVLNWIAAQYSKIASKLVEWAAAFVDWVAPRIPPLLGELAKLAAALLGWLADKVPDIVARLFEWAAAFVNWVADTAIPNLVPALAGFLGRLTGWIAASIPVIAAAALGFAVALYAWISEKLIPEAAPAFGSFVGALVNLILSAIPAIVTAAMAFAGGFLTGVGDVLKTVWSVAIKPHLDGVLEKMGTAGATWEAFKSAASGLARGLIDGIVSGLGGLVEAVKSAIVSNVLAAIENAKKALTGSPSPYTIPIGKALMEGVAVGLADGGQIALGSLLAVMENLIAAMKEMMDRLSAEIGLGVRGREKLTQFAEMLHEIVDVVQGAADVFGSLARDVALPNLDAFLSDLYNLIAGFVTGVTEALRGAGLQKDVERAAEMAAQIRDIVAVIGDAVKGLEAAAGYEAAGADFAATVEALARDLLTAITALTEIAGETVTDETIAMLQSWRDALSALAGTIRSIQDIATFELAVDLQTLKTNAALLVGYARDAVDQINQVLRVIQQFGGLVTLSDEALGALQNWRESLSTLAALIKDLVDISDFVALDTQTLQANVIYLSVDALAAVQAAEAFMETIIKFGGAVTLSAQALLTLDNWKQALQNLSGFIEDLSEIGGFTALETEELQANTIYLGVASLAVVRAADAFMETLIDLGGAVTLSGQALATLENWAQALSDLGDLVDELTALVQMDLGSADALGQALGEAVAGAQNFGQDWVQAIIAGINGALPDLEAVLAYIRGLFPSSPAKRGPFSRPMDVGDYFVTPFQDAFAQIARMMVPSPVMPAPIAVSAMGVGGRSRQGAVGLGAVQTARTVHIENLQVFPQGASVSEFLRALNEAVA